MTKLLALAMAVVLVGGCSSADDAGSTSAIDSGSDDGSGVTTTNPYACPEGEHLVIDGVNPLRCEVHPPDWTGSNEPADPDQVAIDLARELVTDPQRFADIIIGLSPAITDVAPVEFTLTDADLGSAGISFAVTTTAATDAERDDVAWNVMFAIADFWGPGGGFRNEIGQVQTGAVLTVDSVQYAAPMELLMQVYDFIITQPEFIASSRRA